MKRKFLILLAIVAVMCWTVAASADTVSIINNTVTAFEPANPGSLDGDAWFKLNNGTLSVLVMNDSPSPTANLGGVLGSMWFNLPTGISLTLTGVSVINNVFAGELGSPNGGAAVSFPTAGSDPGNYWNYFTGVSGGPTGGGTNVVASIGYSLAGIGNAFTGGNPVDGPDGALVPSSQVTSPNVNQEPYFQPYVLFTFTVGGDPTNAPFDLTDVVFQWGTAIGEGTSPPSTLTPVPATAWLMGSGLLGLAMLGWRRKKS